MSGPAPGQGAGRPELSVVIVTWNSREVIDGCLASLIDDPPPCPWEVVVVDNGSADGIVSAVRDLLPDAVVIANPTNRGLAAANNQGMLAAGGSRLLICNPDVRFGPGSVGAMLDVMTRHPSAAWVVPRLRHEDGAPQTSAGDLPTLAEAVLGRRGARARSATSGMWWDGWAHDREQSIGRGHEAAYLLRRDAVQQVGLQDERYKLDWEGFDWTFRFRAAGWETWFCPAADVIHLGGASIRQVPRRWILGHHRGMYRYFADRRPRWWRPGLAALFASRAGVKLLGQKVGVLTYERAHRSGGPPRPAARARLRPPTGPG